MATKKNATKNETKNETKCKELHMDGDIFSYYVRVFPGKDGTKKIKRRWYMTIELNGAFTLKGCYLTETENNVFISFPQYEKDGSYYSYMFTSEILREELDELVKKLMSLVGIDDGEIMKPEESNLPF